MREIKEGQLIEDATAEVWMDLLAIIRKYRFVIGAVAGIILVAGLWLFFRIIRNKR